MIIDEDEVFGHRDLDIKKNNLTVNDINTSTIFDKTASRLKSKFVTNLEALEVVIKL